MKTKRLLIAIIIAILCLSFALVAFVGCSLFNKHEDNEIQTDNEISQGGMAIDEGVVGNGVKLLTTDIPRELYGEYGITPIAETAKRLTVIPTPANADFTVEWSIAFKNANSTWANGKTVTDYVTLTPTETGALTADVACLQAFGEQITITATAHSVSDVSVSIPVDYVKRITKVTVSVDNSTVSFGKTFHWTGVTPTYGVGTVQGTLTVTGGSISVQGNIYSGLYSANTGYVACNQLGSGGTYTSWSAKCTPLWTANSNISVADRSFSFKGTNAFEALTDGTATYSGTTDGTQRGTLCGSEYAAKQVCLSSLKSVVNNKFKTIMTDWTSGTPFTLRLSYTYTYNGTDYATSGVFADAALNFDATSLLTAVEGWEMDTSGIVY